MFSQINGWGDQDKFWPSGLLGEVCDSETQHIYQNTKAKDSLENISTWMVMNPASQVFD